MLPEAVALVVELLGLATPVVVGQVASQPLGLAILGSGAGYLGLDFVATCFSFLY